MDDVRERVVRPVVSALIRPPDLERVQVGWGPREPVLGLRSDRPAPGANLHGLYIAEPAAGELRPLRADDELWVLIAAAGATWHSQIWDIDTAEQLETLAEVAWALADRLEDWVCEAVYWGEQAIARVAIPVRRS
jgi:hypothetical protein